MADEEHEADRMLREMGLADAKRHEADQMLEAGGFTKQQATEPQTGVTEAVIRGAMQGALSNYADEAVESLNWYTGSDSHERFPIAQQEHPFAYGAGEMLGGVVQALATRGLFPAGFAGSVQQGALQGGLSAAGDDHSVPEGMVVGGAAGGVGDVLGKALSVPLGWLKKGSEAGANGFLLHGARIGTKDADEAARLAIQGRRAQLAKRALDAPDESGFLEQVEVRPGEFEVKMDVPGWRQDPTLNRLVNEREVTRDAMMRADRAAKANPAARGIEGVRKSAGSTLLSSAKNLALKAVAREALNSADSALALSSALGRLARRSGKLQRFVQVLTQSTGTGTGALLSGSDTVPEEDALEIAMRHLELLETNPEYKAAIEEAAAQE